MPSSPESQFSVIKQILHGTIGNIRHTTYLGTNNETIIIPHAGDSFVSRFLP